MLRIFKVEAKVEVSRLLEWVWYQEAHGYRRHLSGSRRRGGRVRCLDRQVLSKERGWREAKKNEVEQKRQKACP